MVKVCVVSLFPYGLIDEQGFRRVDMIPLAFDTEQQHDYKDTNGSNFQVGPVGGYVLVSRGRQGR